MTLTSLFKSKRSQAVRQSKEVAFRDGACRIVVPADRLWDDFFADPGVDLGSRDQPAAQEREAF